MRASDTSSMDGWRPCQPRPNRSVNAAEGATTFGCKSWATKDSAVITRARVPPGPEPPPDNAVCHSPNPGPREGLTTGKGWTERGTGGEASRSLIVQYEWWPAAGRRRVGARGTSSCGAVRACPCPRAGAGAGAGAGRPPCRAGSRAARPPPPPGSPRRPDGIRFGWSPRT